MRGRTWIGTVGLVGAVLVVAGCAAPAEPEATGTATGTSGAVPAGLQRYYDQKLDWENCEIVMQCARLTVPIDYSDPDAGDTTIAVIRQTPDDEPLGSLVVNPGGPGGSGVDYAKAAPAMLSQRVLSAYNIVGFDPRGVGASTPVDCLTDAQLDTWIAADGEPDSERAEQELVDAAERFGAECAARNEALLAHVDTDSVVSDLDVLRAALREPKLNYLGFSYGTKLGLRYAERFGPTTGRLTLDGIMPPGLTGEQINHGQAQGFEDALHRFVADCQTRDDCPVAGDSVDAGVAQIDQFLQSLDDKPLPTGTDRPLTQGLGGGAILYYLYFPSAGDWDQLRDGLRDGFAGDGSTLLQMLDQRLERAADGSYANNGQEAFYAVTCADAPAVPVERIEELADQWRAEAPVLGTSFAWALVACSQWPVHETSVAEGGVASTAPMLLVATRHDPATPAVWAEQAAGRWPNARLVMWESDGHTAYGHGSTCVTDAVDAFLVDGTLPDDTLVCE